MGLALVPFCIAALVVRRMDDASTLLATKEMKNTLNQGKNTTIYITQINTLQLDYAFRLAEIGVDASE